MCSVCSVGRFFCELQRGQHRPVGRGEVVVVQLLAGDPGDGYVFVEVWRRAAGREPAEEWDHLDQSARILMRETRQRAEDYKFAAEFLPDFPRDGGVGHLTGLHLAAGKLPLQRQVFVRGPLGEQDAVGVVQDDSAYDGNDRGGTHGDGITARRGGGLQLFARARVLRT